MKYRSSKNRLQQNSQMVNNLIETFQLYIHGTKMKKPLLFERYMINKENKYIHKNLQSVITRLTVKFNIRNTCVINMLSYRDKSGPEKNE